MNQSQRSKPNLKPKFPRLKRLLTKRAPQRHHRWHADETPITEPR